MAPPGTPHLISDKTTCFFYQKNKQTEQPRQIEDIITWVALIIICICYRY